MIRWCKTSTMDNLSKAFTTELKTLSRRSNSFVKPCIDLVLGILVSEPNNKEYYDKILSRLKKIESDIENDTFLLLCHTEISDGHFFSLKVFRNAAQQCVMMGKAMHIAHPIQHLCKAYQRENNNKQMVSAYVESCIYQIKHEISYCLKVAERVPVKETLY